MFVFVSLLQVLRSWVLLDGTSRGYYMTRVGPKHRFDLLLDKKEVVSRVLVEILRGIERGVLQIAELSVCKF